MANRIICLSRPSLKEDGSFATPPELRLIDPATSATNHGFVPTPESDVKLLWEWLQEYLPKETWWAFVDIVSR